MCCGHEYIFPVVNVRFFFGEIEHIACVFNFEAMHMAFRIYQQTELKLIGDENKVEILGL